MGDQSAFRGIPKVDVLAGSAALSSFPESVRVQAARKAVEVLRSAIQHQEPQTDVETLAIAFARDLTRMEPRSVINASGVILHTGLGRSRLAPQALYACASAVDHTAVEFNLDSGQRGDRQDAVRSLICALTGAEDAFVVNNCAAAVFLTLAALAERREVILSRGQMVEIGGSFRMPDIVVQSGCRLVEVGCTNKVRLKDYEKAITEDTAAILRCHPSNYKIVGFTEEPSVEELAGLAKSKELWLVDDAGSGALVDTSRFGLPREPIFGESLRMGADVAMASGDKLLGGPQAGIIIGSKDAISRISSHPLARTVRVDKLTLAALAATLQLYRNGQESEIPTIRYLFRPMEEIEQMAHLLAGAFGNATVEPGLTEVGGGSIPGEGVPTFRCGLNTSSCDELSLRLRASEPPVIARIEKGRVWLDPRTMEPDEVDTVCGILKMLK